MFESGKTTQSGQTEIIWDSEAVFLLSLLEKERAENWNLEIEQDTVLIQFSSELKKKDPYFGPQNYLDPKCGAKYLIELPFQGRFMSIYQHKDWWTRPEFFTELQQMPKRSQLLIVKNEKDYFVFLAVCGETCRSDMQGSKDGILVTMSSNGINRQRLEDVSLVIAAGKDPYECCKKAVKQALSFQGKIEMLRENRTYPLIFEKFGWCSWDAFYHEVSHQGILEKLEEFAEKKLPIYWVLIDDGWLDADYENKVLMGFDACKDKFPNGLAACIKDIKEKYGVKKTGIWHAVMGYWNGLKAGSEAAAAYRDEVHHLPDGRLLPAPEAGRAFRFYERWHSYLRNSCGVDFVKVDGQSAISLAYEGLETYGEASREIQKGLNASAALHFGNNIINCMGMASEDMWNRPSGAISRSSDDFVPQVSHGFREHALQNSFNSLLQGQFFWGDWDMFWSSHLESRQNAMLRAVSGGPVYISDPLEKTDVSSILPLLLKDGTILRCEDVGMPAKDCLFDNPLFSRKPFKVFNRYGRNYLIGAFCLGEEGSCKGSIRIEDITVEDGREYEVYAWSTGEIYNLSEQEAIPIALSEYESELYFMMEKVTKIQFLGILEKYIPFACIRKSWEQEGKWIVNVIESGTFGFISVKKPRKIYVNGKEAELIEKQNGLYLVKCEEDFEYFLEIIW